MMAKAAKAVEVQVGERQAKKFLTGIMERFEAIDSARGTFMNRARREREGMTTLYESMAALGIPQKSSKLVVKIARATERVRVWQLELEEEDRKLALKLTKAIGDKRQLSLWADLPKATRAAKEEREPAAPARPDLETAEAAGAA
jgi:hypothetical protein